MKPARAAPLLAVGALCAAACAPYTSTGDGQKTPPLVTRGAPAPAAAAPAPRREPIAPSSTLLAGGVSFSSAGGELNEDASGRRLTIFQLTPTAMRFVSRGFAIGGSVSLMSLAQGTTSASSLGIGPRVAYFFGPRVPAASARGSVYPYVGLTLFWTHMSVDDGFADFTASGVATDVGAGLAYMVSESVGLMAEAGYRLQSLKADGQSLTGNQFNLMLGIAGFLR